MSEKSDRKKKMPVFRFGLLRPSFPSFPSRLPSFVFPLPGRPWSGQTAFR
jgi:hypothetical protein